MVDSDKQNSSRRRLRNFGLEIINTVKNTMFIFDMPKVVHIRKPSLAVLHRITQMLILTYFVIYVMWLNKGYQSFDRAISGVTAKLKGIALMQSQLPGMGINQSPTILDESEYRLQPLQNSGFYLITRIASYTIQELTVCPESYHFPDARCSQDSHCPAGKTAGFTVIGPDGIAQHENEIDIDEYGHGIFTGQCTNSTGTCEVFAWCPVAQDSNMHPVYKHLRTHFVEPLDLIKSPYSVCKNSEFPDAKREHDELRPDASEPIFEVLNFTVLIKNSIEFPYFKVKRRNIFSWMTKDYIRRCLYDPNHPKDKYCPKFRIGDIIRIAGSDMNKLLRVGGVLAITITWECNLDWSVDYCLPEYEFFQLDSSGYETKKNKIISLGDGSSVEISSHYGSKNHTSYGRRRILAHVHGIQFLIRVLGRAGKFNLLSFTMKFGSGLALLSIATILNDTILFYLTHDRKRYRKATCDDKSLKRLLSIAASAHLPVSRRTLLLKSHRKIRRRTKPITSKPIIDVTQTNQTSQSCKNSQIIPQIKVACVDTTNYRNTNLDLSSSQSGDESICSSRILIPPKRLNTVQSPRCLSIISTESRTVTILDPYAPNCN